MSKQNKENELGKFLTFVLRHRPEAVIGLSIDSEGWACIAPFIPAHASEREIRDEVANDTKGRFELRETIDQGCLIRCRYGHSLSHVKIAQGAPDAFVGMPDTLYHGTSSAVIDKILKEGLKPMGRNHAHMTTNMADAIDVGNRHVKSGQHLVMLAVTECGKIESLQKAGNEVWTAPIIPASLLQVVDISTL